MEKVWRSFSRGDLVCLITWVPAEHGNSEPALMIQPKAAARHLGSGKYGIALSASFRYADRNGGPTHWFATEGWRVIAQRIGLYTSKGESNLRFRIIELVLDAIGELIKAPPEPTDSMVYGREEAPVGEMSVLSGGKKIIEGAFTPDGEILH